METHDREVLEAIGEAVVVVFESARLFCDPIDSSPAVTAVLGILQARTQEWVAISFSNA